MPKLNLDDPDGLYRFLYVIASRFGPREALYGKQIGVSEPAPRRPRKARNTERPAERASAPAAAMAHPRTRVHESASHVAARAKFRARQRWADNGPMIWRSFAAWSKSRRKHAQAESPARMLLAGRCPLGPELRFAATASGGRLVRTIQRSRKRVAKPARNAQ